MGSVHRLVDDDDEPRPNWCAQLDASPLTPSKIVRNAPMVKRQRPNTITGILRQMNPGDAYNDRRGNPRVNRCAWTRAARVLGFVVQTVTADDGTLWVYRRR